MTVSPRDGALHAVDQEKALGNQVLPRPGKGREDEELAEVVIGVVGSAQRTGLRRHCGVEGRRDPNEEQLDGAVWRIRLLPDVACHSSVMSARFTGPDRLLNSLPRGGVNAGH
jgi:hypothetical protein